MAGLVPAIHVFTSPAKENVDARVKPGHDDGESGVTVQCWIAHMALIARMFVIAVGFFAASLVAGMIIVVAVLFPEFSDLGTGPVDQGVFQILVAFGFIFISGVALLPAAIIALITEAFSIRSVLAYAIGGAVVGAAAYLSLVPFDPDSWRFDGIVRRHMEIMTGAGIVAGLMYWMIAGRNAGAWRAPIRHLPPSMPPRSGPPY